MLKYDQSIFSPQTELKQRLDRFQIEPQYNFKREALTKLNSPRATIGNAKRRMNAVMSPLIPLEPERFDVEARTARIETKQKGHISFELQLNRKNEKFDREEFLKSRLE